jgi:hypothetical protein
VDQNRKPGVPPTKDISDLKARLGLKRPDGAGAPAPGAPAPAAAGRPQQPGPGGFGQPQPGRAPAPAPVPSPQAGRPTAPAPQQAQPPAGMNPYAKMKAPTGGFDLRSADDGMPAASVRKGRSTAVIITAVVVGIGAFVLGGWAGGISMARNNFNTANSAARSVKAEIEGMQKTLDQIGGVLAASQARLAKDKKDVLTYDPQLIADLERIKLDPRPNTAKIFRVDYFRLPDADVDKLFNYYYDSISLYGEVERHIKRSKADAESLAAFAQKQAAAGGEKHYGIVFDNSQGKLIVSNLVEVGDPVCKNGGKDCPAADMTGFKVRSNTGAPWVDRKSGSKLDLGNVVPMKPTPFMDAVMSGSLDQVRAESYKQRLTNVRMTWQRTKANQKELIDGIAKDATRPDIWTVF